jgi:hypothetical protein
MHDEYGRKISAEEAREGYVFVRKDQLSFFPPLLTAFRLETPAGGTASQVESYPCVCRGPDLPHEHYFIRCQGLRKGTKVVIRHTDEAGYALSVAHSDE